MAIDRIIALIFVAAVLFAQPAPTVTPPAHQPVDYSGPGYRLIIPAGWRIEERSPLATTLTAPRFTVDIYTQPLGKKPAAEYIEYSNKHLLNQIGGIKVTRRLALKDSPDRHEVEWSRPAAGAGDATGSSDQNYYRQVNLVRPGIVYTFILRAASAEFPAASAALDQLLGTFGQTALEVRPWSLRFSPDLSRLPDPNPMIAQKYVKKYVKGKPDQARLEINIPSRGLIWGLFEGNAPVNLEPLSDREARWGVKFDLVMTYRDFTQSFPLEEIRRTAAQGRLTMITWQPWNGKDMTNPVMIPEIVAGQHDNYIRQWARAVKDFGQPVLFRFANEMNGDWDGWSVYFFGFDHSLYIKAWRHAWQIFQNEGATNAMWVWNPHDRSYPDFAWNDPHLYYPGDQYVDWVGLTGYNTGPRAGDRWQSFNQIYRGVYDEYRLLYPGKPMLITEFASDEFGGDKAGWIRDAFHQLKNYPAIKLAVWYDYPWWKWNYPLKSSPAAERAFFEGLKDPYYRSGNVWWDR